MPRSNPLSALRHRADLAREDGQAIVLVALLLTSLFGFIGLVVDVAWFQVNLVRVQRAADAGALAGSVYLPGNVPGAQGAALAATTQNGYTHLANNGVGTITVNATQDPVNSQLINVTVTAPIRTWFMRLFGVTSITGSRNARAEFILPVPMGSPQNYYGIARLCDNSACNTVNGAGGGGPLASQGFWGAVITKGGNRRDRRPQRCVQRGRVDLRPNVLRHGQGHRWAGERSAARHRRSLDRERTPSGDDGVQAVEHERHAVLHQRRHPDHDRWRLVHEQEPGR
jgi:hypothetical protein